MVFIYDVISFFLEIFLGPDTPEALKRLLVVQCFS